MSHAIFSDRFLPQAGPRFLADRLGSAVVAADLGPAATSPLLTWSDLNAILSTGTVNPPRLRLYRSGAPVPLDDFSNTAVLSGEARRVVRPADLYRHLREGASLIVDAVDRLHPPIREAADDLMRLVREPVQVNLYVVWGDTNGFDTHWDDHDTFVVQLMGMKDWTVHGPGRPHPMRIDVEAAHSCPDTTVWKEVLAPGQAVHVPRGWWHTVRGTGGLSMHLTFGFTRATGIDWLSWLVDKARAEDLFRQDLPRFADETAQERHFSGLVTALVELAQRDSTSTYLHDKERQIPRRQRFAFPWAVERTPLPESAVVEFATVATPAVSSSVASG